MTESPRATVQAAAAVFVVKDVAGSVAHYQDVLGFHVEFRYGDPPSYAGVERGSALIHLQAAADSKRPPGQSAVYIFVTHVDALYDELKSRGARILAEPKNYPYGMRDFAIADLDGNQLTFGMESST
jgi:uncharacterized glyoxalase superfamily protein PhnB